MITHKVETHNSPSALDPFGGSITGIVGVNRDTIGFGMGAKPVANTFGFCFGYPDDKRIFFKDKNLSQKMLSAKRIIDGVIKGVNVGGNCSGIPTVNGFVKYDDRFRGKPLVFVGTVGLIPRKINGKLSHEKQARPGDYIVMIGGKVGADGIHGATFSSVVMDSTSPATAVQIGDPITQKKLSDAIVKEARNQNLYTSITDNGAGGISCSVAEMAKECGGAVVDIDSVPLKYPGLTPWQIWISESQERMTLSVPKNKWKAFVALMESRGVLATRIGEFTDSGKCIVKHKGKIIMDMPMEFLHNGLPLRPLDTYKIYKDISAPVLPSKVGRTDELLALLGSANIASFKWISEQYDHEVQAGSVLKPLSGRGQINTEAQVVRPLLTSEKGVVLSSGEYPSYSDISTYDMAGCAIDTAIRNAIASGASLSNLAILDNFCWCSSYDRGRLAELVDSLKACYDYAVGYGTPFISGKDSMFNDFKGYDEKGNPVAISIPPTLLISAIGVIPQITKCVTPEFKMAGDAIYVLGETNDELGASEYVRMIMKNDVTKVGTDVPTVDYVKNTKIYLALEKAIAKGLVASSISVNSGGLGIALARASLGGMLGTTITLDKLKGSASTIDAKLFSESQGRIVVSIARKNMKAFENLMKGVSFTKIGIVSNTKKFIILEKKKKVVDTNIEKLYDVYHKFSQKMS
jgi:phosphoribosylformylglycinamidine synthase